MRINGWGSSVPRLAIVGHCKWSDTGEIAQWAGDLRRPVTALALRAVARTAEDHPRDNFGELFLVNGLGHAFVLAENSRPCRFGRNVNST